MSNDVLTLGPQDIRGTDSNSLLRMYDQASAIFNKSPFLQERTKADKAVRRIAKELQKRAIPFTMGPVSSLPILGPSSKIILKP